MYHTLDETFSLRTRPHDVTCLVRHTNKKLRPALTPRHQTHTRTNRHTLRTADTTERATHGSVDT